MTLQVEFWQLIGLAMTILGAFWGIAKMVLTQSQQNIHDKQQALAEQINGMYRQGAEIKSLIEKGDELTRRLEREVMELKAELPREYVRRDDYTQAIATIMTKLDGMALRFENILLKGHKND